MGVNRWKVTKCPFRWAWIELQLRWIKIYPSCITLHFTSCFWTLDSSNNAILYFTDRLNGGWFYHIGSKNESTFGFWFLFLFFSKNKLKCVRHCTISILVVCAETKRKERELMLWAKTVQTTSLYAVQIFVSNLTTVALTCPNA